MKPLLVALFSLLVLSPTTARAQSSAEPAAVPFRISSLDTGFAMQGDFEGEYRVYPNEVRVKLTRGLIRIGLHCPYKGQRELQAVRFSLATEGENGKYLMAFKSLKLHVGEVMSPGDEHTLDGAEFTIPKEPTTDLSKHWFVVQMDDLVLDHPTRHEPMQGYAFADSCKDIFVKKGEQ
jgi:hypothetical protein